MNTSQESPEPAPPSNEAKDFAKQLVLYADTITAFSVVQLIAFIYLLADGDCFAVNVLHNVCYPIAGSMIVGAAYVLLVGWCHHGENCIFKSSRDRTIAPLAKTTWMLRYAIIIVTCAATVGVLAWVNSDKSSNVFRVDCKEEKSPTQ